MKNLQLWSKVVLFAPVFIFCLSRLGEEFGILGAGFLHDELIFLPLLIPIAIIGLLISTPSITGAIKGWKIFSAVVLVAVLILTGILFIQSLGSGYNLGAGIAMLGVLAIGVPLLFIGGLGLAITGSLSATPQTHKSVIVLTLVSVMLLGFSLLTLF